MAVNYIPRPKPTRRGLWGNLLSLGADLAAAAGSSVRQAASDASAGQVAHKPCDVCTSPVAPVRP